MSKNTASHEFTAKNLGDCAVWTRPDGSSQSVTITGTDFNVAPGYYPNQEDELRLSWKDSSDAIARSVYLPRSRWNELTLFPAGCKFMVV